METKLKTFDGLAVSSKFAICGLPIRFDTYKTCGFGCAYCFSNNRKIMEFEKTLQIANLSSIQKRLERVLVKNEPIRTNFLDMLITNKITWHCGGMSDPFQPIEEDLHVTKDAVDLTNKYDISILFSTKSDTLYDANVNPYLHTFQLSVTNVYDRKDIEPNVPFIERRLELFKYLKNNGFRVGIRIQPFIPNVTTLDIVKMFEGADHFTLEGIKLVPQNKEHKDYLLDVLKLDNSMFTQKGLLTLKADVRKEMYQSFIEYFTKNNISYSISDNDLRLLGNNKCCCGDRLVTNASGFDTTCMLQEKGLGYSLDSVLDKVREKGCEGCVCKSLFTSNRTNGCITVEDFYNERFEKKSSPFSPKFQIVP